MSKTVVPEILEILKPWLDARMKEWETSSTILRSPTLPEIGGKIDLRTVIRKSGIKPGHEQHFYRKPELQFEVNVAAEAQGLRGIGSRADMDAEDKAISDRITQIQKDRNDCSRALAEAHAQIERLRRENTSLRAQLEFRAETGMVIRVGNAIHNALDASKK